MLSALKFMISPKKHYEDNSSLLDKWAKEVYKAGNNTCIRCGAVGVRLPRRKIGDEWYSEKWKDVIIDAHHVYPKSIYPKLVYKVSNGVCLCRDCHTDSKDAYHKMVSLKDSSPKTLKWWLQTTKKEKQPTLGDIVFATIIIASGILFAVILFLMKFKG